MLSCDTGTAAFTLYLPSAAQLYFRIPGAVINPGKRYSKQKKNTSYAPRPTEHWVGWLSYQRSPNGQLREIVLGAKPASISVADHAVGSAAGALDTALFLSSSEFLWASWVVGFLKFLMSS